MMDEREEETGNGLAVRLAHLAIDHQRALVVDGHMTEAQAAPLVAEFHRAFLERVLESLDSSVWREWLFASRP